MRISTETRCFERFANLIADIFFWFVCILYILSYLDSFIRLLIVLYLKMKENCPKCTCTWKTIFLTRDAGASFRIVMCKVIRFKKTLCTVHLAAEIRRCWRCSWVVFIHVVFQQHPLLDERTAAGKKSSFAWWLFVVILTVPRSSLKQQCFRVFAPAFGCPFLICQTERVTKQNSAPTWQEGVRKCMELSRFQQVNLCWQWWLQISVHASIVVWIIRWKLTFDILSLFKETCARYRCHQVLTTIQCNTKQCSALQYNAMYYITLITFD